MSEHEKALHEAGVIANRKGYPKRPPLLDWRERHWWLAGWNQEDLDRRSRNA